MVFKHYAKYDSDLRDITTERAQTQVVKMKK